MGWLEAQYLSKRFGGIGQVAQAKEGHAQGQK